MKLVLLLASIMICCHSAFASGDRIGNGGGLWACYNQDSSLRSGILVDLFEAREQFQIIIPNGAGQTPLEILNSRLTWLRTNWPEFTTVLDPYISRVEQNLVMVDAGLVTVDDAWPKISPLGTDCYGGHWLYTQFANYTSDQKVLVNNVLWTSSVIAPINKAALLLHESVYLMLREQFGDQDSVRARQANAILLSNLPSNEIRLRIEALLNTTYGSRRPNGGTNREPNRGPSPVPTPTPVPTPAPVPAPAPAPPRYFCSMSNSYSNSIFSGYADTQIDAEFAVRSACEAAGYSSRCEDDSLHCDIFLETGKFSCIVKNTYTSKSFNGHGRNPLEAEYTATLNCQKEGYSSRCELSKCGGK